MTPEPNPTAAFQLEPADSVKTGWRRGVWNGENLLVALALGLMIFFPLAEIVLRFWSKGISGSNFFEQHLTLIVGMLGGAIAAREQRLLSLSTLSTVLKGKWKSAAAIFATTFAVAITVFLCIAAVNFVQLEKEAGKIIAYNIPLWVLQSILPVGFAVIAARLLWHVSESWLVRGVTLL